MKNSYSIYKIIISGDGLLHNSSTYVICIYNHLAFLISASAKNKW